MVHHSGQLCPLAYGQFSGPLPLRRSKLAKCPLASTVHTTPLVSMSSPRGENPFATGTSYTSASVVAGGFDPGFSRTIRPGNPSTDPQIIPSAGLTVTP